MAMIEDTPETMIRTDLWPTMTMGELAHQQDLMIKKISAIYTLMGAQASPSIVALYNALSSGSEALNALIEQKSARDAR